MADRILSRQEAVKVLTSGRVERKSWLESREDLNALVEAADNRRKTVTLSVGVFTCRYEGESVFLKPLDQRRFVPCGWFNLTRARNEQSVPD